MKNLSSLSKSKIALVLSSFFLASTLIVSFLKDTSPTLAFVSLAFVANIAALFYIGKTFSSLHRAKEICLALSKGDFESRLTHIKDHGEMADLMWSINEMADHVDAYIRESTACMEYVSHNQYFRNIMEDGMHGSILQGAKVINGAMDSVRLKMSDFGDIADKVDASLHDVMTQIGSSVISLRNMTQKMEDIVSDTRHGAEQAARFSSDTSTNVQVISAAAEEMSSSIAEISQQMSRTSRISENAVEKAQSSAQLVEDLVESSKRIGEVVAMIQDIADQTNLLALNATIEAARAGEMGKGFAVVASEVKTLATQTAKATEEIAQQVQSIQNSTIEAVKAFQDIGAVVNEINEAAAIVASAIEEQNAASQEIATNAGHASNGTIQVAENIGRMESSVGEVGHASREVAQITNDLTDFSENKVVLLMNDMQAFMQELKKIT